MKYDLSILIPARNEMFVSNTVADILKNKRGNTEVLVGLDGAWAEPGIADHPDVRIIYVSESIGQRAMANKLCRLSQSRYVAKCDAHCAFDEGFDVKLIEAIKGHDNWTVVPVMRNLHAFNWVCKNGHERYQGPSGPCTECGEPTERDVVWIAKQSPQSVSYRFDRTLHFQYHKEYAKTDGYKAGIITGYKLSFYPGSISISVVNALADFASSHSFSGGRNSLSHGQNMASDTVGLPTVDDSGSVRTSEVGLVGDKLEMQRVATSTVPTDMVNDGDILPAASGDRANQPSEGNSMSECLLTEMGTPTITPSINASNPIPTSGSVIHSNIVDELNDILGGEFVYDEKTSSFHNNSVTLTLVRDNTLSYTMSLQGSFFMMTREKYWELNICDEAHGSWGQQGTEVACKTWLSGGQVMVNHKTWYAHMFRTQGSDFGFPYEQSGRQVDHARKYSRELFLEGKWDKAIHPLSWLIEKFAPVPDWDVRRIEVKDGSPTKGIIYYTDNQFPTKLAHKVQDQIRNMGLPIVSASLKPMTNMGKNLWFPCARGKLTMFMQILAALENSKSAIVFFCEHDVLYHPSHFNFTPPEKDKFYYNTNVWRVRLSDGKCVTWEANQVAELCGYRDHLLEYYKNKIKEIEEHGFDRSYEPGGRDASKYEQYRSEFPNIDIRHDNNLSKSKWSPNDFRDKSTCVNWQETTLEAIPGWNDLKGMLLK